MPPEETKKKEIIDAEDLTFEEVMNGMGNMPDGYEEYKASLEAEMSEGASDEGAEGEAESEAEGAAAEAEGEPAGAEAEPEQEADSALTEEPESEGAKKDHRIPKERFDEVNNKKKAAEAERDRLRAELEQIRSQRAPVEAEPEFDFTGKRKEYIEAMLDGEIERALAIEAEIDTAKEKKIRAEIEAARGETTRATKQELDLEDAIIELTGAYPVFDKNTEEFNEDLVNDVNDRMAFFMHGKQLSPAAALRKAVDEVAKLNNLASASTAATGSKPTPAGERKTSVADKARAAAAQPPTMKTGTTDRNRTKPNLLSMSDAEWKAMSEADKRRARGDFRV